MPSRLITLSGIILLFLFFAGCGSSDSTGTDGDNEIGTLNNPCFSNNTCQGTLVCVDFICQLPVDGDEDGDIDQDNDQEKVDQEPEMDYECFSTRDCEEGYICLSYECVKETPDGDEEDIEADAVDQEEITVGPELFVDPIPVNFGSVPEGHTSKRQIYLTNVGTANLMILDVQVEMGEVDSGYGTYELTAPVANITLTPGEEINVEVKFTRIYENPGNEVAGYLNIKSTSITGENTRVKMFSSDSYLVNMTTDPADSIDFGNVALGSTDNIVFKITNPTVKADMGDLIIEKVAIVKGNEYFAIGTPAPSVPRTIEPDGSAMLIPIVAISKMDEDNEDDSLIKEGKLAIYHNDPTMDYPYLVPISLNVIFPELFLNPSTLEFGSVSVGDTTGLLVTIRNHGGEEAIVDEINFTDAVVDGDSDTEATDNRDYFSVEPNPPSVIQDEVEILPLGSLPGIVPANEKRIFRVDYNPLAFGNHSATIEVVSNDVNGENFSVSMTGNGIPPLLSIVPNTLSFSPVQVGQIEERTVTISYNGSGEIQLKDAFIEFHQLFKITESPEFPVTLTSGSDPVTIKVMYQPINQSSFDDAELTIVIGAEETIDYIVPINGSAITAQIAIDYDNASSFNDVQIVPDSIPSMENMTGVQQDIWVARTTVTISNPATAPLHISSIFPREGDEDIFGVDAILPLTIQPLESATFDILFAPRVMTNYEGRIIICSDATNSSGTTADCETDRHKSTFIDIAKTPINLQMRLDTTDAYLEFEQPEPNGFTTEQVIITNIGTSTIHIDSIEITNPEGDEVFFIDDIFPAADANGWDLLASLTESITISLRFEPTGEGAKSGSLVIRHDDKDASANGTTFLYPLYSVTLSGNGLGNTPPVAMVKASSTSDGTALMHYIAVLKDATVYLNGSSSYDVDQGETGDFVAGYTWSIDQSSGFTWNTGLTGSSAQITFSETGTYNVNLEVVDHFGDISAKTPDSTIEIHVEQDPVAIIAIEGVDPIPAEMDAYLKVPIQFDATESYDPDGEIVEYRWYFGPDKELISMSPRPLYTFTDSGYFDIYLEVVDNDGRVSPAMDVQNFNVHGNDTLRIEATWTNGGNVDLHYIAPGGSVGTSLDCSVSQQSPDWGEYGNPQFVQGSTDGSKAEIITHDDATDGIYKVVARYIEATQSCHQESKCFWHDNDCDICGCSCWKPLCYVSILDCCKSCNDCEWYTVCEDKPTKVKFYIYVNNESDPIRVVEQNILESGNSTEFSLTRSNGYFN